MSDSAPSNDIELKNVKAGFLNRTVCEIDSLQIKRNCITVLCGPNGAGKSTLLKTIAKQIPLLSGEVLIDSTSAAVFSRAEIAKRLAFVPQFIETRRSLTVAEWVSLGRNPHQEWWSWKNSAADRAKIIQSLERTNCIGLKDKMVDELSGGERQRVMIATALAQEPAYMLLDEPTAHLDFRYQLELLDLLRQLKSEGLGILLVLHDLSLTARIADEVVLLKKEAGLPGCIAGKGSVGTVLTPEALRSVYSVEMEILRSENGSNQSYVATSVVEKPK